MTNSPGAGVPLYRSQMRWDNILWGNIIAIGALHVGCIFAPFTFTWGALGVAVLLAWMTGGLGITLGFHRLLTHRSFKTYRWIEYLLTVIGCLTWQGGPPHWVGTHRIHHKESDQDGDPHSPQHGFTWAHMLWCFIKEPDGHNPRDAARDMLRDPVHAFIDRWFWAPQVILAAILYAVGGWPWVVWGICVRTVVGYHFTWFVNSAAHTWGYRNFETTDGSRNLWWVALVSFGEGWHNNHHAFQRSASHGLRWWELDVTHWTIRAMQAVGLAWDVIVPDAQTQTQRGSRLAETAQSAVAAIAPPVLPSAQPG